MLNQKGQIRIIEAFLAISVMFSALALTVPVPSTPETDREDELERLGTHVLIELDKNGVLGKLVDERNWATLERSVEILLPIGVYFNLAIYDERAQRVNTEDISNTSLDNLQGRETVSAHYLFATHGSYVVFYRIQLQLAWVK